MGRKHGGRRKGAGRPPVDGAQGARLALRVRADLLQRIESAATAERLSAPDYIRAALDRAATETIARAQAPATGWNTVEPVLVNKIKRTGRALKCPDCKQLLEPFGKDLVCRKCRTVWLPERP